MGRNPKKGLEYFPLDCFMNDEVNLIIADFGIEGFGVLISLYQTIYGDRGYYINWNTKQQKLFAKRVNLPVEHVTSIVDECLEWGIFSSEKFEGSGILTSRRIQDHYAASTYKRIDVKMDPEHLLIDISDKKHINKSVSDIGNAPTSPKQPTGKPPKKPVKPKAPQKDEVVEAINAYTSNPDLVEALKEFRKMRVKIKKSPTARAMKSIFKHLDEFSKGDDLVKIKILDQSILKNWQDVYELKSENVTSGSKPQPSSKPKNKFNNFKQHGHTPDAINEMLAKKKAAREAAAEQSKEN